MPRRTGPDKETRELVVDRDQGRCAKCGHVLDWIPDLHHRRPRGMGGTKDEHANGPGNLVTLDRKCHQWVEANREQARATGFLVSQSTPYPQNTPIQHALYGRCFLNADGTVTPEGGRRSATFEKARVPQPADSPERVVAIRQDEAREARHGRTR